MRSGSELADLETELPSLIAAVAAKGQFANPPDTKVTWCQRRSIRDDQSLTSDHCLLSLMSAFASMMSLRMITVRASFGGFPALTRV